jgi:RNA polymerase sigma-70 factor, ECF subfamily
MATSEPTHPAITVEDPSALLLERLRADGQARHDGVEELRSLLLRAARFELRRRATSLSSCGAAEIEELAQESADDALMAVLRKLDTFRGESRFTTWAYKFALLEASVKARRRIWRDRELPTEPAGMGLIADRLGSPHDDNVRRELIAAILDGIRDELTPRQRSVLVAVTIHDVPIDVLAQRMNSNRGALYKTLHDARAKLRAALAARGFEPFADAGGELR